MKIICCFLLLILSQFCYSQDEINLEYIDAISLNADTLVGIDDFENYYFTKGNTLYKKTTQQTYSYTNTQLGAIASVDITNPLKIIVFYRDFNTIAILDNRLNELSDRINLNEPSYGKNAAFISISSNNNIWIFSLDDNILTLWNYETKKVIFESQPLQFYQDSFEGSFQVSNYEHCWVISKNGALNFNQYGSFIKALNISEISAIQLYNNGFIYSLGDKIYYNNIESTRTLINVDLNHLSTNFFVNKNTLTFFRSGHLYSYRILKN